MFIWECSGLTPVERWGKPDWAEGGVQQQSKPNNSIRQTHRNLEQKNPMSEVPVWGQNDGAIMAHLDQSLDVGHTGSV